MELSYAPWLLFAILALDAILGDPVYAGHPIRLLGKLIRWLELRLFAWGLGNRWGGIVLVLLLLLLVALPIAGVDRFLWSRWPAAAFIWDLYWGVHGIALQDLLRHTSRIGRAVEKGSLAQAHQAVSQLVGRDTAPMDQQACVRAGIESLAENLTDGVIAPLFWFILLGIPGLVMFKIASTLDSMVGYKDARYLYFGWAGARLDDVMNWIPARLTWLSTLPVALLNPAWSSRKAWRVTLRQHACLPSPNSGWSECAFAGALQLRLAGPIWRKGVLVNTIWLGEEADPSAGSISDLRQAQKLAVAVTLSFLLLCIPIWLF